MTAISGPLPGAIWQLRLDPGSGTLTVIAQALAGAAWAAVAEAGPAELSLHPDERAALLESFQRSMIEGLPLATRFRIGSDRVDGGWRWIGIHAQPLAESVGLWTAFVHDAGAEVAREDALVQERDRALDAERRIREVIDRMPGTVFELRREVDSRVVFTFVSEGVREMSGLAPADCLKNPMLMFARVEPADLKTVIEGIRNGEMGSVIRTYRIRDGEGRHRWVRNFALKRMAPDGAMIATCCIQDFTEAMELQQQLAEARDAAEAAERRVREITEALPGAVYEMQLDLSTGRGELVYVTDGIAGLYGMSREDAMASHRALLATMPADERAVADGDDGALPNHSGAGTRDHRIERPDGEVRWLRTHSGRRGVAGSTVRWVGHMVDVTAEKAVDRELALAKEHAEAASRAKSEFLANMSHEIRTPMNAVLSFAYLGLRSADVSRQADYFAKIETAARSLLDIINDVLDLSKIEAGKLELDRVPFSLGQVLDNLESVLGLRAQEKGLAFRIEIAPEVPTALVGDPLRLGQVLMNLGGNAVKFTEAGAVTIRIRRDGPGGDQDCALRFEVEDSGIGLGPEQIARLFSPFTQADTSTTRRFGGTGLGLSISKRLVELMGGTMSVRSEPGIGSTFCFRASFEACGDLAVQVAPALTTEVNLRGLTVLVVDDHVPNLEVARDLLQSAGVAVELASSGVDAIAAASAQAFDAIFMDMRMPGMDGMEATRRIRAAETAARVPIIALTANVMAPDRKRCLAAGMDDFVGKPIDVEQLFAALARACGRQRDDLPPLAASVPAVEGDEPDHDFERARARVARTPQLYERLAARFVGDADFIARLRAEVAANRPADAAITAHTLKGAAAQVGALKLARLAAQLEASLGSRLPAEAELAELERAMQEACERLLALQPEPPPQAADADAARLEPLLARLQQQLEDDEDEAWNSCEALIAALPAEQRERWAALARRIANLEYDEALALFHALRA